MGCNARKTNNKQSLSLDKPRVNLMPFSIDRYLLTSITTDNCRCLWSTVIDYYRPGCITVDYYRLLLSIMDRYRLLSIIIVPGVTHTMGITSEGSILMVVMAVRVADCTA
jgi:hypothetical protein